MLPTLRPFTQVDWYGWAGAAPFKNGESPLITERADATLIVAGGGVEITIYDSDGDGSSYAKQIEFGSQEMATCWCASLVTDFHNVIAVGDTVAKYGLKWIGSV